jgi:PAS domain S-box-containing protein
VELQETEFLEFSNHLAVSDFMPHGYCYLWDPWIVWLNVFSDGLITLSYYCIPVVLLYFIHKRRDLPFNWIFWMFGSFILACGTTHLMEVWNVWHASYALAGVVKAVTAFISLATLVRLIPLLPQAIAIPNLIHLQERNRNLEKEIAGRKRSDEALSDAPIQRSVANLSRTAWGILMALGLTGLALFSSARASHPDLHTILDTGMFLLSGLLALWLWDIGARNSQPLPRWLAVSFALTSLSEFVHTLVSLEWSGFLAPISEAADAWRPGTWPPAAYLLPIGIGCSVWLARRGGHRVTGLALALIALTGGLFTIFHWLPRYSHPTVSGITRPVLILVPLLWTLVGLACWTLRASDRMFSALAVMSIVLMVANISMLYSRAPHDAPAMVAHLGRVGGYLALLLALMQMASFDMLERVRSERELGQLNEQLEVRILERTAQLGAANSSLELEIAIRRETESALHESQDRLTAIIGSAMDSIITTDAQQGILLFNTAAEKMFGCPAAEALGQPITRFIPQRFHAAHTGHIKKFGEAGVTTRAMGALGALWAVRDNGEEFQIEASISQVVTSGKKLFTVILRDVTERVQADAALKESLTTNDRALKELADQKFALDQHAIVAVTDVQGTITYVNDKFCAISKYSRDELIGQNHRILNSGHHPTEFFQQMYRTIANGEVWHAEIKNRAKDGSIYWVDTTIVPTLNAQGKPRQYVAIRTDITERVRVEEVRESLAAVVESSDDAIISKSLDGTITAWNSGAEKLFGYSSSEALGKPMRMLLAPERANEESDILARIGRGEGVDHFETVRVRKDGKNIDVSATVSPMRDSSGVVVGASNIARDITERKLAEKKIRKLNDELEHRVVERTAQLEEANQELESFTYSVAHDLRAPLRHIAGFSGILVEEFGPALSAEAQRYLQRIQEGTQRMGRLVDELLTLAKVGRQPLNLQIAGLNSIVQEVIGMLQPDVEGRQVEWKIADLPFVECDPALLRQVFQNLISNALKYSRPRSHSVIEIGQILQNEQPVVFVRDNGVGFSMKYADKLFGVFQRLHRSEDFEGTGVGLATVQRIIKKHQGQVWAEAELDKGATFYFTLGGLQPAEEKKETMALGAQI